MKPKLLSIVGELNRIARYIRRDAKGQRAMGEEQRAKGNYDRYEALVQGREIGLTWAAQRVAARARAIKKEQGK